TTRRPVSLGCRSKMPISTNSVRLSAILAWASIADAGYVFAYSGPIESTNCASCLGVSFMGLYGRAPLRSLAPALDSKRWTERSTDLLREHVHGKKFASAGWKVSGVAEFARSQFEFAAGGGVKPGI